MQERQASLLTLDERLRFRTTEPSAFVDDGHKPVFRVTTRLGRVVDTTATHPFLTMEGWQALSALAVGDCIAVPRRLPVFGGKPMRDCEVKLLGCLIGDGCLRGATPKFINDSLQLQTDFIDAANAFGGVRALLKRRPNRTSEVCVVADHDATSAQRSAFGTTLRDALALSGRSQRQLALATGASPATVCYWLQGRNMPGAALFDGIEQFFADAKVAWAPSARERGVKNGPNALTRWLMELELWGRDAHDKCIPASVFELPKAQLALFLNRLFATDGWATLLASGQCQIGYASASERLARQVQHLLLRFGVIAKLRFRRIRRQQPGAELGEQPAAQPDFSAWQLDLTDADSIRTFATEIGIYSKEPALQLVLKALDQKRRQTNVDLIPVSIGERLSDLAASELFWDSIVSIEPIGLRQVYDLTIPETHNFVANDICVHNTSFAMNMAENVAIKTGKGVAVFSMEMPGDALAMRMMSSLGQIDQHRVRTGKLTEEDWPRLTSAVTMLSQAPMYIDDTPALSPTDLRARVRRLQRDLKREEKELGMIVIDYLQLMQAPSDGENRATEISAISRSLKSLAKELHVPVVALSQLNRSLEQRPNKRPVMSDLRESGAIEQDADVIAFIYRDEVYNEDSPDKGVAEIIIAKQRNGPIGTVKLAFLGQFTKFENLAEDLYGDLGYQ